MKTIGICFGATTMQCVELNTSMEVTTVENTLRIEHKGNPSKAFFEYIQSINRFEVDNIAITGRSFRHSINLSSISEPEAIETALSKVYPRGQLPQIMVSCGGETQLVYSVNSSGGITSVHTGNKCASGTGEFFQQQIRRMGLTMEEAIKLAEEGEPYKIAGRCSVFCKSDCTHALNKGEPVQNIVAGLCAMMADKIDELIKDLPSDIIAVIGGGAKNSAMLNRLRRTHAHVLVPNLATLFEAYGAALWALNNPCKPLPEDLSTLKIEGSATLNYHPPLKEYSEFVEFKHAQRGAATDGDICILGLDVGSTTTKAVLLRESDKKIIAQIYLRTNGNPIEASRQCYQSLLTQVGDIAIKIVGVGVTGSGRQIAGLHALTNNVINEIIAHATAASYYDMDVDTIFEIGGQDAKYTYLTGGVPSDYAMNEACSAGTGSFLEESAFETLGVRTEEIGPIALSAKKPPDFSDQCAAFISSDIKRAAQQGVEEEDILAGLVYSICLNYVNRVKGNRPVGKKIFMQGGVCYNRAVPYAMASIMQTKIIVPPDPGLMGAFGVALEVSRRLILGLTEEKEYDLAKLANREARKESSFICAGGKEKCDRKCEIARIRVDDRLYPFGGMCDFYYNTRIKKKVDDVSDLDFVKIRQKLLFDVYGPTESFENGEASHRIRTVGLNNSLIIHTLYPLFSNFFHRLGFKVVLPDTTIYESKQLTEAAFCRPVEIAHEHFNTLLKQYCDYIFIPQVMQIPVPNVPTYSRLCPFVQGEPYYLKTTFRKEIYESNSKIVSPVLKMEEGYEKAMNDFIQIGISMGASEKEARNAYQFACEKQLAFENEMHRYGRKILYTLEKNKELTAIILFGRPYNAFAKEANMGIPHKVASRGYMIIPHDMIPADRYQVDKKMFWAMGQKIMKGAQLVKKHSGLFGFYITNFSCGPDSFLLKYFRDCMGSKPSLTLELDQHTADAGIDTRIEAALDIVDKYRRVKGSIKKEFGPYSPARLELPYVYTSKEERVHIHDSRVEVIIPSMGQRGSQAIAAILRSIGINAKALPVLDNEGFVIAKKNTSGKECLPFINTTGSFLKHLEQRSDPNTITLLFMATGGGPCRLGQYYRSFEQILLKRKIPNTVMLPLTDENGYAGLGRGNLLRAWQGIVLSDVLNDIRSMLRVCAQNQEEALIIFEELWDKCLLYFEGKYSIRFTALLRFLSLRLSEIPLKTNPAEVPVVSLIGEIFVRHDEFSRQNIVTYLEDRGFMVRIAPVAEYLCYSHYVVNNGLGERKFTLKEHLKMRLTAKVQEWWEKRIKSIMAGSALYKPELMEVHKTIEGVRHLLDHNFRGECILTVGLGMREILEDSCGIVSIGPFGCMYSRMAEAILKKEMNIPGKKRMPGWKEKAMAYSGIGDLPFLSIETDGNPFTQITEANLESFILQARRVHNILKGNAPSQKQETVQEIVEKR